MQPLLEAPPQFPERLPRYNLSEWEKGCHIALYTRKNAKPAKSWTDKLKWQCKLYKRWNSKEDVRVGVALWGCCPEHLHANADDQPPLPSLKLPPRPLSSQVQLGRGGLRVKTKCHVKDYQGTALQLMGFAMKYKRVPRADLTLALAKQPSMLAEYIAFMAAR